MARNVGQGSSFWFTIRCGVQKTIQHEAQQPDTLQGIVTLVVDDIAINRQLLAGFAKRWGMEVLTAANAEEALQILAAALSDHPVQLVLSDVQMPDIDGWVLAEQIRDDARYNDLKLVLLPSAGKRGDAQRCRQLRVNGYLTKPVIHSELYDALKAIIHGNEQPGSGPVTRHQVREAQRRCSILLVDDVEINRELAKIMLEKLGHQVELATNGQEALDKVRGGCFDLVFMDIQMPVMDGFEATSEIRSYELAHQRQPLPIIAMTAYALQGDKERCLASGMDEYIAKPIKEDDLRTALERFVTGQVQQEQPVSATAEPSVVEAAPEQPRQPVFDRQALLSRLGGNEALIQKFVTMFFDSADEHLELLQQAAETGDTDQLRAKAHAIKGSAGNVGACALSAAAAELEKAAREGLTDEYAQRMDELEKQFKLFRTESGGRR